MYTGAKLSGTKLSQSALNYLKTLEKSSKELRQTTGTSDSTQRQAFPKKSDRRESFSSVLSQIRSHENNTSFESDDFASIDKMSTIIDSDEDESTRGERVVLDLNFDLESSSQSVKPNVSSKLPRWKPDNQVGRKSIAEIRELRNSIDKSLQPPPLMEKKAHKSVFRAANSFGDIEEVTTEESGRSMEEQITGKIAAQLPSSNKKSPFKTAVESGSSDLESIDFEVPSELPERISGERRVSFKEPVSSSNGSSDSSGSTSGSSSSSESDSSTMTSSSKSSSSKQSNSSSKSSSDEKSADSDPGSSGFESSESSSSTIKADSARKTAEELSSVSSPESVRKSQTRSPDEPKNTVSPKLQESNNQEVPKTEKVTEIPERNHLKPEPIKRQTSHRSSTPDLNSDRDSKTQEHLASHNSRGSSRRSSVASVKETPKQSESRKPQASSSERSSDNSSIPIRKSRRSSSRGVTVPSGQKKINHDDLSNLAKKESQYQTKNRRHSREYRDNQRRRSQFINSRNTSTVGIQTEDYAVEAVGNGRVIETCCSNAPQMLKHLMESQLNQLRDLASLQMNTVLQNERFVQEIKVSYDGPNTEKLIKLIEQRTQKYQNIFI